MARAYTKPCKPIVANQRETVVCANHDCFHTFQRSIRGGAKLCKSCRQEAAQRAKSGMVAYPTEAEIYGVLAPALRAKRPEPVRKPQPLELVPLEIHSGRKSSTISKDY